MRITNSVPRRLAALCITLAIPVAASAGVMTIPITEFPSTFVPGNTTVSRLDDGRLLVTTRGITIEAIVACGGEPHCLAAGLDNQPVPLTLNLRLTLDPSGTTLDGRIRGTLEFPPANIILPDTAKFAGEVSGRAQCQPGTPPACATAMRVAVTLDDEIDESLLGIMELALTGTLTRNGGALMWESMTVEGDLAVLVP